MDHVRVIIDPIGRSHHWIRPHIRQGRCVIACTRDQWRDGDRIRRRPVKDLAFRCGACQLEWERFLRHLADVEAMRCDLFEGYDDEANG